jgi:hypothetical protein
MAPPSRFLPLQEILRLIVDPGQRRGAFASFDRQLSTPNPLERRDRSGAAERGLAGANHSRVAPVLRREPVS